MRQVCRRSRKTSRILLAAIVREDDDPRVRRAAVSKLGTVAVLADTLGRDADEGVRDEAAGVLLDIALGAYEADEAASLAALDALGALPAAAAQKHFVLVAKTAQRESICRAALGRLGGDQKALGTVCRRAEIEAVRMAALEGLTDPAELVATALRSNFRDVALGALERIASDQAALKSVATRAANPAAARKARALLRALEDEQKAAAERETDAAACTGHEAPGPEGPGARGERSGGVGVEPRRGVAPRRVAGPMGRRGD